MLDKVMAFVATADAARARHFYEETLGLRFVSDEPFALVFDVEGILLRIQRVHSVAPASYTALGWQVRDIYGEVERLAGRGGVFERFGIFPQDERGIWTAPGGAKVAWFKDPDGNTLSLTQL